MRTLQEIRESGFFTIPEAAAAVGLSAQGVSVWLKNHEEQFAALVLGKGSPNGGRATTLLHPLAVVALHPMNRKRVVERIWTERERAGFDGMQAQVRKVRGQAMPELVLPQHLENVKDFRQAIERGIHAGAFVTAETIARKFGVTRSTVSAWIVSNYRLVVALHAGVWRLSKRGRPVDVWLSEIELYFDKQTRGDWRRGRVWPYMKDGVLTGGAYAIMARANGGKRTK